MVTQMSPRTTCAASDEMRVCALGTALSVACLALLFNPTNGHIEAGVTADPLRHSELGQGASLLSHVLMLQREVGRLEAQTASQRAELDAATGAIEAGVRAIAELREALAVQRGACSCCQEGAPISTSATTRASAVTRSTPAPAFQFSRERYDRLQRTGAQHRRALQDSDNVTMNHTGGTPRYPIVGERLGVHNCTSSSAIELEGDCGAIAFPHGATIVGGVARAINATGSQTEGSQASISIRASTVEIDGNLTVGGLSVGNVGSVEHKLQQLHPLMELTGKQGTPTASGSSSAWARTVLTKDDGSAVTGQCCFCAMVGGQGSTWVCRINLLGDDRIEIAAYEYDTGRGADCQAQCLCWC